MTPRAFFTARHLRGRLLALACTALAACSSAPPAPDWQMNAHGAAQKAVEAYLSGNTRVAGLEFARARQETARTGEPALLARIDSMAAKADAQVFGPGGVMPEVQATVVQLGGLLADTRASLKKVDAVLAEVQAVGANVREGTADLGALRAEVESNLRKIDSLVNEINRKWPFARETEIKLP